MRRPALLLAVVAFASATPQAAQADAPIDPRDRLLHERAVRIGTTVAARHVTPEGLLAYAHRHGATPQQLSHDCLKNADTGIWSGCYAASAACRYAVTRDPEALALARRCAAGLELLSTATGVEGAISRAAGRPLLGEPLPDAVRPSPFPGFAFRADASRDTLVGIVLGWECLARFVDDPEVRTVAARNLRAIALRLVEGGMKVRDADGSVTKHGKLDAHLGPFENGSHAAIGAAAVRSALRWNDAPEVLRAWKRLCDKGWDDAIDAQQTWVGGKVLAASNVNMAHLGLLVVALADEGKAHRNAMEALRELRRATRGWHNGGFIACALLAGQQVGREESVAELRATLLAMPATGTTWTGTRIVERGDVVPVERRPIGVWSWKQDPKREEILLPETIPDPDRTFTRADFLFAYWLARAAGELDPGPVR